MNLSNYYRIGYSCIFNTYYFKTLMYKYDYNVNI